MLIASPGVLVARAFADAAKNHLPVSIGVINKPGGGGAIGLSEIAAAGGFRAAYAL